MAKNFQFASVSGVNSRGSNILTAASNPLYSRAAPNSIRASSKAYEIVLTPSSTTTSVLPSDLSILSTSPLI